MPKTYAERLLNPKWQKKRLEILGRDVTLVRIIPRLCVFNVVEMMNMQCFSLTVAMPASEVITLCKDCHAEVAEQQITFWNGIGAMKRGTEFLSWLSNSVFFNETVYAEFLKEEKELAEHLASKPKSRKSKKESF